MRHIRKIWYDNPVNSICLNKKWPKENAVVLYAYLDQDVRTVFKPMFPQFADTIRQIDGKFDELCDEILSNKPEKSPTGTALSQNFNKLKQSMAKMTDTEKKNVIKNFLADPSNFEALYMYVF